MKNLIRIIPICIFFCLYFNVKAQRKVNKSSNLDLRLDKKFKTIKGLSKEIQVTGKISDLSLRGKELVIEYYDLMSSEIESVYCRKFYVDTQDSVFSVTIKDVSDISYIRIRFRIDMHPYDNGLNNDFFLCKKGDSINVILNKGKIDFNGSNASEYRLQTLVSNIPLIRTPSNRVINADYLRKMVKENENRYEQRLKQIEKFNLGSGSEISKLIRLNSKYEYLLAVLLSFRTYHYFGDSLQKVTVNKFFNSFANEIKLNLLRDDANGLYINSYYDFLLQKELCFVELDPRFLSKNVGSLKYSILFDRINKRYTGFTKDRLLAISLCADILGKDGSNLNHYMDKIGNSVKDFYSKKLVMEKKAGSYIGMEAYNFQLTDTAGNIVKLSDFKGKVVVMDFYFTGCGGCEKLSRAMTPIIQSFSENNNVVFLSIDIDKSKSMFLSSVKSGLYSHPKSICLYTNGEGENNNLIKFYRIHGYPKLLIIDSAGKIFDSNPSFQDDHSQISHFIKSIEKAGVN